jgi:hypothetical protein
MRDLDPTQYAEADRREVNPPIEVESATWSPGGTLDWWVKERRPRVEWYGVQTAVTGGSKLLIFARAGTVNRPASLATSERRPCCTGPTCPPGNTIAWAQPLRVRAEGDQQLAAIVQHLLGREEGERVMVGRHEEERLEVAANMRPQLDAPACLTQVCYGLLL